MPAICNFEHRITLPVSPPADQVEDFLFVSRIQVGESFFLGFEYFNAIYFSDLSIFAIFAPVTQTVTIMTEYIHRNIDSELIAWKEDSMRKPLLLRGARQVGKSSAVKNFGKQFEYFAEVNFERNKAIKTFFQGDIDVRLIAKKISSYINVPVEAGRRFYSSTKSRNALKPSWHYASSRKIILSCMS